MTYEDIKIGDLLYNKENEEVQYLLIVWKDDNEGRVGGRVGRKKGDQTISGYKIDLGNDIIVDINSYNNFLLRDPDDDYFGHASYLKDKAWVDGCEVIAHLSDEEINLFWILSGYTDNYDGMRSDLVMSLKYASDDMKSDHVRLALMEKEFKEAEKRYHQHVDEFVTKYYPKLKDIGSTDGPVER